MNARFSVKKNSDFRRIYAKGKSFVTPCLVVYSRKNRSDVNRVGFTVSAKLGNAVCRNRTRRRLREVYRLNSSRLAPGHDIILVARSRAVNADYTALNEAFLECCRNLELCGK